VEKLRGLDRLHGLALVDMAERFWAGVSIGELIDADPREWVAGQMG